MHGAEYRVFLFTQYIFKLTCVVNGSAGHSNYVSQVELCVLHVWLHLDTSRFEPAKLQLGRPQRVCNSREFFSSSYHDNRQMLVTHNFQV